VDYGGPNLTGGEHDVALGVAVNVPIVEDNLDAVVRQHILAILERCD
jgi:hypothetical protein